MAEPAKLCINCAHYSLDEPGPMPDPSRKHWCTHAVDLITGGLAYSQCGENRYAVKPFYSQHTANAVLVDNCGQEGKYFVAADLPLSLPNAEYAKEFIAAASRQHR